MFRSCRVVAVSFRVLGSQDEAGEVGGNRQLHASMDADDHSERQAMKRLYLHH